MISNTTKRNINRLVGRLISKVCYYINLVGKTNLGVHGHCGDWSRIIVYDPYKGALMDCSVFETCNCVGCHHNISNMSRWRLKKKG